MDGIVSSGGFPSAYIFHICGLPWAATNSPELKTFLDAGTADALTLKRNMFGIKDTSSNLPDVTIVTNIPTDYSFSQNVQYGDDRGLTVSGWNMRVHNNPAGFAWTNNSTMEQWGLLGLDWQPVRTTKGAASSVLALDIEPTTGETSPKLQNAWIYWPKNKDNGLKAWLDAEWGGAAYDEDMYLYCSGGCFRAYTQVVSGDTVVGDSTIDASVWKCRSYTSQYNAPNEQIFASVNRQHIYLTNYPQAIDGLTANLFAVELDSTGSLNSGTKPFTLATGKVAPGSRSDGGGTWSISVGGWTDQFKTRIYSPVFKANLEGYQFNTVDSNGVDQSGVGDDLVHAHHMYVTEVDVTGDDYTSSITKSVDITASNYAEFDSIQDIIEAAVDRLNADGDLTCTYTSRDGEIYVDRGGTSIDRVYMAGCVPWACGLGYVDQRNISDIYKNLLSPQTLFLGFKPSSDPSINWKLVTDNGTSTALEEPSWTYVRIPDNDTDWEYFVPTSGLDTAGQNLVKNKSACAYFIQADCSKINDTDMFKGFPLLQTTRNQPEGIPTNSSSNYRLYYTSTEGDTLTAGDQIALGPMIGDIFQRTAIIDTADNANRYITLDSNQMLGMPWAFYWAKDLQEALQTDEAYKLAVDAQQPEVLAALNNIVRFLNPGSQEIEQTNSAVASDIVNSVYMGDPFEISYSLRLQDSSPVNMFKSLLGDPAASTDIELRLVQTGIKDLFDRGDYNSLLMIDFDSFNAIVSESGLSGALYGITAKEEAQGGNSAIIELDIIKMLQGVLITHGGKMVWKWREQDDSGNDVRCWWLTFAKAGVDTIAQARNDGRVILEAATKPVPLTGVMGGDWHYSGMSAKYRRQDGGTETFNYKLRDGRIQHSLKDKTLTVQDNMTILPADTVAARDQIIDRFSAYLQQWSRVKYQHEITTTLNRYAAIAPGLGVVVSGKPMQDRTTGKMDASDLLGEVRKMDINIGREPQIRVSIITEPEDTLGISPTMYLSSPSQSTTTLTCSGAVTDSTNNDFADPNKPTLRTDLSYFDCYEVTPSNTVQLRTGCTCGDYAVTVFERGTDALYSAGANQNMWRGTIGTINLAAGTYTIELDTDNNFSTVLAANGEFVVMFANRDHEDIQTCQLDYGWLGRADGLVVDKDANTSSAILIKGT
jgi:hypothetical protein